MRDNLIKKDTLLECLPLFARLQHYPKMDGAIFIKFIAMSNRTYIIPIKKRIKNRDGKVQSKCLNA